SFAFQYNNYQELTKVTLPTGAGYEYSYAPGLSNGGYPMSPNGLLGLYTTVWTTNPELSQEFGVYRRLMERRVYRDMQSHELESKTVYEQPVVTLDHFDPQTGAYVDTTQIATVKNFSAGENLINETKHHFFQRPEATMFWNEFLGPLPWNEGKEF